MRYRVFNRDLEQVAEGDTDNIHQRRADAYPPHVGILYRVLVHTANALIDKRIFFGWHLLSGWVVELDGTDYYRATDYGWLTELGWERVVPLTAVVQVKEDFTHYYEQV